MARRQAKSPSPSGGERQAGARPLPSGSSRAPEASSLATRHVMQANRSKNTSPELKVRAALRDAGLTGYRIHWKKAPGHPDVCFVGRRVAIFVHGCFWHRCPRCSPSRPKTHSEFWQAKFARNRARDARDCARLVEEGWTVLVVWECQLKGDRLAPTMERVVEEVRRSEGGARPAMVREVGMTPAWRLRVVRERRRRRRG